jgi:hypothetical protein
MQRIFNAAFGFRTNHQKFGRPVRVAIRGYQPEAGRENGDKGRSDRGWEQSDARRVRPSGRKPVVIVTFPSDVEVLTRVARE